MNVSLLTKNEKFALFYGILLGDGCLSYYKCKEGREKYCVSLTGGIDDKPLFEDVILPLIFHIINKKVNISYRKDCNAIEVKFLSKDLFLYFNNLGFNSGKKQDIVIPVELKNNLNLVIAGLFATDGCLTLVNNNQTLYPRLFITATLPSALKQIADYLNKKSIKFSFYTEKRIKKGKGDFKRNKQMYVLSSNGSKNLEKFRNLISFINPKYEKKYFEYKKYKNGVEET